MQAICILQNSKVYDEDEAFPALQVTMMVVTTIIMMMMMIVSY